MNDSTYQKIVIIEKIDKRFFPLACSFTANGCQVCFFSIDEKVRIDPRVQNNLEKGVFLDLSKVIFDYILLINAAASAHKNLDMVFEKFFSRSPSIRITKRLFGSSDIENMYKKEILLYLNDLYFLEYKINTFIQNITIPIEFYPAEGFTLHSDVSAPLSKKITIVRYKNLKIALTDYRKRIEEYGLLFYPLYIFLRKVKGISFRKKPKKTFRLGINVNLPGMFSWNYHYINYLVDDLYGFPKDEIIFVDESYRKEILPEFKFHGFAYENFLHQRVSISPKFLREIICHFIPAWLGCMFYCLTEERVIVKTTRLILSDYIRWNMLMDCIRIQNHVTILLPDRISKNHILSSHDCRTYYIYPDNSSVDYHTGWDEKIPVSILYSFINADYAVVFGEKIKRYFSYHRNNFKEYLRIGVLAAQIIREIREGKIISSLPEKMKEKNLPKCIIGVFDTSFVDYGPIKIRDGIQFGNDILKLLDDFPKIGIVFKEKKFLSMTPELACVYEKLEQHPRCVVVRKTEQDCIFSSDVIAVSDLVISAAYTSTNAEALAAKTRCIYYDISGTDIGDNFYFNRFPNTVAHNYSELKELVQYWLNVSTEEDFDLFLKKYVKNEIDPYLDMKAIDRLHSHILDSNKHN